MQIKLINKYLLPDISNIVMSYVRKKTIFHYAQEGNYEKVINWDDLNVITRPIYKSNLIKGFTGACNGGHLRIVKRLFSFIETYWLLGIRSSDMRLSYYINDGIIKACLQGHIHIIQFFIDKNVNIPYQAFGSACYKGHMKLVNIIKNYMTTKYYHLKHRKIIRQGFVRACSGGSIKVVKLLITDFANISNGFNAACRDGRTSVVKYLLKEGVTISDLNEGLAESCKRKNLLIVNLLLEAGAAECRWGCKIDHIFNDSL